MNISNIRNFLTESKSDRTTRARTVKGVPTALGLFVGAGGLDLGFRQAGFQLLAASDFEPEAQATHQLNWPQVPFILEDARKLTVERIAEATRGRRPDVIIGGPPCQGFSTLGSRLSADPRNDLVDSFMRIIEGLRPQAVVIENVRAIATEYNGRYRDYILSRLRDAGYSAHFSVLNAADFGVPQLRKRAFFVAFADPRVQYVFPRPTHGPGLLPYETVGPAIMDLVERGDEVPNHIVLRHSEKVIARYRFIKEGGMLPKASELPEEIRRENFGSTYKRLHRDAPALTIVPGNNALPVHPTLDRSLTPREAARIQSFPDDYIFTGDRRRQCILVGNAVPPKLGKVIAHSVWTHILPFTGALAEIRALEYHSKSLDAVARAKTPQNLTSHLADEAPTFVDLFCGAGGFKIGFSRAGLRPLVCADYEKKVRLTHEQNYPDVPFILGDLGLPEVQNAVVEMVGQKNPFLVVGGPPCQGFSMFGKRRMAEGLGLDPREDPRNRLVFSFVDTVSKLMPQWVVMENVAGFVSLDGGWFVEQVVQELKRAGYSNVEYRVLDTAHYGVPQRRKRFVLIANRSGHIIPWPKKKFFEQPEDWQKPFRTVGEAIGDLAGEDSYSRYTCHVPMNHKPLQVERYKLIPEGGKLDIAALPPELRKGYRTEEIKNFSHVFKRLDRNKPASTMVPGHNAFPIHPWLPRALTVREAARIQTFPDEVKFVGARQDQCIQVGNAFPPLLAELIANNILRAVSGGWKPGAVPKLAKYSLIDVEADLELVSEGSEFADEEFLQFKG